MRRLHLLLLCTSLLAPAALTAQQADVGLPSLILEVPVDSLGDIAVAVYHTNHGIIYYNPRVMAALGPDLAAFFRQHELGHLYHHHVRGNALLAGDSDADAVMQVSELEADCYAARMLSSSRRPAIDAAVALFSHMGNVHSPDHPSGAARAAMILSCVAGSEE